MSTDAHSKKVQILTLSIDTPCTFPQIIVVDDSIFADNVMHSNVNN